MVYRIEITVPKQETRRKRKKIDQVLIHLGDDESIKDYQMWDADQSYIIMFRCHDADLEEVLSGLEAIQLGKKFGSWNAVKIEASKPEIKTNTVMSRLPVEIIYREIYSQASISFDYLVFCIVGAILAGIGLATDNSVTVVASMLVSPLMGPILAFTFGALIRDKQLVNHGLFSEFCGIGIVFFCGLVLGLCFAPFGNDFEWPTQQMADRGTTAGLVLGAAIALPSGVGVALSVTGGVVNSLVGVAISAALLPPIVNSGMNFVYAFVGGYWNAGVDRNYHLIISGFSFTLLVVNIVCIFIAGIVTLKLKQISPKTRDISELWEGISKISLKPQEDRPWNLAPGQSGLYKSPTNHFGVMSFRQNFYDV
eukprot:TRINITY_DN8661_c0_g1_i1.p1 TRINITY_DN8661_c0_g1~~TRINITY_DN8661_c0_g1_i1.p1  ORF type:complete len:367 (+),score=59.79 TRINITY_DN8661_c0_g1_i1:23-1123(+)